MASFLPVFITRASGRGMADSGIAIPAISHEHFLPVMGFQFPESAEPQTCRYQACSVVLMPQREAITDPWRGGQRRSRKRFERQWLSGVAVGNLLKPSA